MSIPNYSFEIRTKSGSRYTFIWDSNCKQLLLRSQRCNGVIKKYQTNQNSVIISVVDDENGREYTLTTSDIKTIHYF